MVAAPHGSQSTHQPRRHRRSRHWKLRAAFTLALLLTQLVAVAPTTVGVGLPLAAADDWPGGGTGSGGSTGPGGLGGSQFVPPGMPQPPTSGASNSLPPLDQANSISIYNQTPSQATPAQGAQSPSAEQSGSPAHGQQPSTYDNAPQQIQQMSGEHYHPCDDVYAAASANCVGSRTCWERAMQIYANCLKK